MLQGKSFDGTQEPNPRTSDVQYTELDIRFDGTDAVKGSSLLLQVSELSLVADKQGGAELIRNRQVKVPLSESRGFLITTRVKVGKYDRVLLVIQTAELRLPNEKPRLLDETKAEIPLEVELDTRWRNELRIRFDTKRLLSGESIETSTEVSFGSVDLPLDISVPATGEATLDRLSRWRGISRGSQFEVRAPRGSLVPDSKISISEGDPEQLPPLFQHQTALGSAVRVSGLLTGRGEVEITLPYDGVRLAQMGYRPEQLVVLQLDDRRTRYRELFPNAIDPVAQTVMVRVSTFSFLFPGTPGIWIHMPEFARNAVGEVIHYSSQDKLDIYGNATDQRAVVTVPTAQGGWSAAGWFVRTGIPLPERVDNFVELRAEVEGLVPHDVVLNVRRHPPSKRVVDTTRLFGPALTVGSNNTPYISHAINRFETQPEDPEQQPVATWTQQVSRHSLHVYFGDIRQEGSTWPHFPLSSDDDYFNEVATQAIEEFNVIIRPQGVQIQPDPAVPERIRALTALNLFLESDAARILLRSWWFILLRSVGGRFGLGHLTYSPTAPLRALPGAGGIAACYVMATARGLRLMSSSGVSQLLQRLYDVWTPDEQDLPPRVHVGRLYYVAADLEHKTTSEIVAEDIWCARVAMKLDPRSGQPAILAIGFLADADDHVPRSRLLLYRRTAAGVWEETLIDQSRAYVDGDFALETDGEARVIASVADAAGSYHLVEINQRAQAWDIQPLEWPESPSAVSDRGMWPSIVIDRDNRSLVGFVSGSEGPLTYHVGRESGTWQFRVLDTVDINDLMGARRIGEELEQQERVVEASGMNFAHFAPSLALLGRNQIAYAYPNGVLKLATIDSDVFQIEDRRVDVDRRIGFFPSVAARPHRAIAVAYKDVYGWGELGRVASDDLHFFSSDIGPVVPPGETPPVTAPAIRNLQTFINSFGQRFELSCPQLIGGGDNGNILSILDRDPAVDNQNIRSIIMNRPLQVWYFPLGSGPQPYGFRYWYTHNRLADMIWMLPRNPELLQITVDNTDSSDPIQELTFMVPGVLLEIPGSFAEDFRQGTFPRELAGIFRRGGLAIRQSATNAPLVEVTPSEDSPDTEWDLLAENPFGEDPDSQPLDIHYYAKIRDDKIDISIRPILSITEDGVPLNSVRRYSPCGLEQRIWDFFSRDFGGDFARAVNIEPTDQFTIRYIRMSDVRITEFSAVKHPADQQGGVRFTLTIPQLSVVGFKVVDVELVRVGVDIEAHTTGPSVATMEFAPYVLPDRTINWYLRNSSSQLGHIEVDVDVEGVLGIVLGAVSFGLLGIITLIVGSELIDDHFTGRANRETKPPKVDGFANLLLRQLRAYTTENSPIRPLPPVDACYLDNFTLNCWFRRPETPTFSQLPLIFAPPSLLGFSQAEIGGNPVIRRALVINSSSLVSVITSIEVQDAGGPFSLLSPQRFPIVLRPGNAETLELAFQPRGAEGHKETELRVIYNDAQVITLRLFGWAVPPPDPQMEVFPSTIAYSIVPAGTTAQRAVRVSNRGAGQLLINQLTITPDASSQGVFATGARSPLRVPPADFVEITIEYSPTAAGQHRATLYLDSNDPFTPQLQVPISGVAAGASSVWVLPASISFPDFPVEPALPPIAAGYRSLNILNQGANLFTVTADSFQITELQGGASPHFQLIEPLVAGNPPVPLPQIDRQVVPGGLLALTIRFRPVAVGDHTAQLVLRFVGATQNDIVVPISGKGIAP